MKKKIIISVVIIIIIMFSFLLGKQTGSVSATETSGTTSQMVEVTVETQTIQKTLTGSGQIATSETKKLTLNTAKYFKTMCVEEDDIVEKGENILQYSNGTYLTAPYDCVISSYLVPETGKICTTSNYIEIKNLEVIEIAISINESEINSVKAGQEAQIVLGSDETKTYTGEITKIDAIGTYSSSGTTFNATIQFENDRNIKLGMSASTTVILQEAKEVVAVPIQAIQTESDKKYVLVVKENGETQNITVETGIANDTYVQITSGLTGGETIQMLQTTTSSTKRTTKSGTNNGSSNMSSSQGKPDFSSGDFGGQMMPTN